MNLNYCNIYLCDHKCFHSVKPLLLTNRSNKYSLADFLEKILPLNSFLYFAILIAISVIVQNSSGSLTDTDSNKCFAYLTANIDFCAFVGFVIEPLERIELSFSDVHNVEPLQQTEA